MLALSPYLSLLHFATASPAPILLRLFLLLLSTSHTHSLFLPFYLYLFSSSSSTTPPPIISSPPPPILTNPSQTRLRPCSFPSGPTRRGPSCAIPVAQVRVGQSFPAGDSWTAFCFAAPLFPVAVKPSIEVAPFYPFLFCFLISDFISAFCFPLQFLSLSLTHTLSRIRFSPLILRRLSVGNRGLLEDFLFKQFFFSLFNFRLPISVFLLYPRGERMGT